jgi:ubiquinone/menaquinone biosynthesis C-methylase UbiE
LIYTAFKLGRMLRCRLSHGAILRRYAARAVVDIEEYRQQSHAIWEQMAAGWSRERDFMWDTTRAVGERLVAGIDPQPGETILELAAGVGDTGFATAPRIGDEGRLISTDFSPEMVGAARERARELGLSNVEHRVMDAEKMDLDDDSVDGVLCRWGYMLMADPAAAFRETRRVLRPGGRLAFAVWAGPESNPWAAVPGMVSVVHGHMPPPEPEAPGMFALADEDRIRSLVAGAGFETPRIEALPLEWRFTDFDQYWGFIRELAGALALVLRELSDEEREAVRADVETQVEGMRSDGGYAMPAKTLVVVAE